MKTSTHICGFWFHIDWNGNTGKDQNWNVWSNPEQPEMEDKNKLNSILDAYNTIVR